MYYFILINKELPLLLFGEIVERAHRILDCVVAPWYFTGKTHHIYRLLAYWPQLKIKLMSTES